MNISYFSLAFVLKSVRANNRQVSHHASIWCRPVVVVALEVSVFCRPESSDLTSSSLSLVGFVVIAASQSGFLSIRNRLDVTSSSASLDGIVAVQVVLSLNRSSSSLIARLVSVVASASESISGRLEALGSSRLEL